MWVPLPIPAEPNKICPGFCFASAIRSFTDLTPIAGLTTSTSGVLAIWPTPTMSFGAIVRHLGVQGGAHGIRDRGQQERLPVRRGAGHDAAGHDAAGARTVVGHDLMARGLGQFRAD